MKVIVPVALIGFGVYEFTRPSKTTVNWVLALGGVGLGLYLFTK